MADEGSAAGPRMAVGSGFSLRTGAIQVGVGLAFFGLSTYVFTAVVLRALGPAEFAEFNVFWGLAYGLGLGAMMPFEQEISRRTATALHARQQAPAILSAGILSSVAFSAVLAAAIIPFVARSGHSGTGDLWAVTVASFVALGIAYVSRGGLSGHGSFRVYGAQLVVEGAVRLLAVWLLLLMRTSSPIVFAAIVPVALGVAVAMTWRRDWRVTPPPRDLIKEVARSTAPLVVSSMVSLTLVNLGPVAIRYVEEVADPSRDGSYLAAAFIARLPIFVFAAVQAVLIPRLTRAVVRGDSADFRRSLAWVLVVTVSLGTVAIVTVALVGPWLLALLAGSQYQLPVSDMVLLTAALACYLLTLVLQPAAIALGRHRETSVVWLLGAASFAVAWLLPVSPTTAVSCAIGLASSIVSAGLAHVVVRGLRRQPYVPAGRTTSP